MAPSNDPIFKRDYQTHLQHLKLKGLQPKTIEAYARAIRRIGDYFGYQLHDLSEAQLLNYFSLLLDTHSWSGSSFLKRACSKSTITFSVQSTVEEPCA